MIELTEEQVASLLVGRPVEVSVGEPWNFASPDGDNILKGSVVCVRAGADIPYDEQEIELEVTPFDSRGGRRVTSLTARARYEDEVGIVERLAKGEDAYVNLEYGHQVSERELPEGAKPFLIGGIRLACESNLPNPRLPLFDSGDATLAGRVDEELAWGFGKISEP